MLVQYPLLAREGSLARLEQAVLRLSVPGHLGIMLAPHQFGGIGHLCMVVAFGDKPALLRQGRVQTRAQHAMGGIGPGRSSLTAHRRP